MLLSINTATMNRSNKQNICKIIFMVDQKKIKTMNSNSHAQGIGMNGTHRSHARCPPQPQKPDQTSTPGTPCPTMRRHDLRMFGTDCVDFLAFQHH